MDHGRMDHEEVGRYWDENAEVWTEPVRAGCDFYRDGLNTPAFLAMLPETRGLSGLDIGCGEGHSTRLLAERAARMVGIDISGPFVRHAREAEEESATRLLQQLGRLGHLAGAEVGATTLEGVGRSLQRCCVAGVRGSPQGREAHRDVFEKQLRELGT